MQRGGSLGDGDRKLSLSILGAIVGHQSYSPYSISLNALRDLSGLKKPGSPRSLLVSQEIPSFVNDG